MRTYCILPNGALEAITVWIIGTYCFDVFRIYPKLCITSPQKRCGKSTLMEVIDALTNRALMASNISPAVIFRIIEKETPTLLLDEADTWLVGNNANEEMRGIINSGHSKTTARVIRCVGDDHSPTPFSTWAPMVIGMIGSAPETIADRSLLISMRRKTKNESVSKLAVEYKERNQNFRRALIRWANDNKENISRSNCLPPNTSNDRAFDNWTPLFQIADTLGEAYRVKLTNAFSNFTITESDDEDAGIMLLKDIKQIFDEKKCEKLSSNDIVLRLINMTDQPWAEWKRGKPLTTNTLSRLLKPFDIKSCNIRFDQFSVRKGYTLQQFIDAFERYI